MSIDVTISADMRQLAQDMAQTRSLVGNTMDYVKDAGNRGTEALSGMASMAKTAMVALAGIGSIAAFANMIKGAIDGTAALHDLSIQTGASVAALGQFRSVGSYTETSIDAITGAMLKLSKNMAMSNEDSKGAAIAIRALGLDFNDFKKLSPEDQMLAVAKAMNGFKDGSDKSAAAMLIFGKEGAKMLPFLKDLGDSIEEITPRLTDQEKALKKTQAAMADAFTDNLEKIRKNSEAWKKDLATGLTPALYEVSKAFIDVSGGAGGLKEEISKLSKDGTFAEWARNGVTVLTYLVDAGIYLKRSIQVLGEYIGMEFARLATELGAVGDAVSKAAHGDFAGAFEALQTGFSQSRKMSEDFKTSAVDTFSEKTLGQQIRARMAEIKGLPPEIDEAKKSMERLSDVEKMLEERKRAEAEAIKAAREEQKKQEQAYAAAEKAGDSLLRKIAEKNAEVQMEIDLGRILTPVEKEQLKLTQDMANGVVVLTGEKLKAAKAGIEHGAALEQEREFAKQLKIEHDKGIETLEKRAASLTEQTKKQLDENYALANGKDALEQLEIARLNEERRLAAQTVAEDELIGLCNRETEAHKDTLKALNALIEAKDQGVHLKAAKEAADAWAKTTDEIGKGLTDSLFRAFESGKSFFSTFWDGIKNLFKTTVLKMLIQPVQSGVSSLLGGVLGMGSGSASAGTGGGLMNMLSNGSSVMSMMSKGIGGISQFMGTGPGSMMGSVGGYINNFGNAIGSDTLSNFGAGMYGNASVIGTDAMSMGSLAGSVGSAAGGFMLGRTIGQGISGGYSAIGGQSGNTAVNVGAAIGAIWGPLGSAIGGAIGGLVNRAFGMGAKSTQEYGVSGNVTGGDVTAQNYANWKQKGGWFRSDKSGTDYSSLTDDQGQMLKAAASSVYAQTKAWAETLKLPADELKKVNYALKIQFSSDEKANIAAINTAFAGYQDALAGQFRDALAPFQKAGETLVETMNRLSVITSFSESLNQFGGVFSKVAQLSISAKEELIGFAGGMEAFIAKTQDYVSAYYTDSEKVGLQAKQVEQLLASIGVDGAGLSSKADFRKLVESQNLDTTEGRKMLNDLLSVAPAFAQLGDYLEKNGGTLGSLAGSAPQSALLENILSDQKVQAEYQQKQADSLAALQAIMDRVNSSLNSGFDRLVGSIEDRMAALQAAIEANGRTVSDAILEAQP